MLVRTTGLFKSHLSGVIPAVHRSCRCSATPSPPHVREIDAVPVALAETPDPEPESFAQQLQAEGVQIPPEI